MQVSAFALVLAIFAQSELTNELANGTAASNGIPVTVERDDFSGRSTHRGPRISIENDQGDYGVMVITENGAPRPAVVGGHFLYVGDWRYFHRATLRGGEAVEFVSVDKRVVSCAGARTGGRCLLQEPFLIRPTPEQIRAKAENGVLRIRVEAMRSSPVMLSVPVAHFDAVAESAARRE